MFYLSISYFKPAITTNCCYQNLIDNLKVRLKHKLKKEKRKMSKKRIAIAVSVFLMFAMITSLASLPVKAHDPPWDLPTFSYVNVAPNPTGVGQPVNVNFWLNVPPPTASGAYGDRWHGLTVEVTDPDGHVETLGPFTSDDTGGTSTRYTPDQVGTWKFQLKIPTKIYWRNTTGRKHTQRTPINQPLRW